jgi:hypothetical protein
MPATAVGGMGRKASWLLLCTEGNGSRLHAHRAGEVTERDHRWLSKDASQQQLIAMKMNPRTAFSPVRRMR